RTHSHAVLVPISIVVLVFELNLMTLPSRDALFLCPAIAIACLENEITFILILLLRREAMAVENKE
ncbi:hypothetical protein KIH86_24290, partial [Paenibacillus sp. HN-1]